MNYIEYTLRKPSAENSYEIIVALLDNAGYSGFVETTEGFLIYIPEEKEDNSLEDILSPYYDVSEKYLVKRRIVPETNWNAQWESDFKPITIEEKVLIRASFHEPDPAFQYDIIINPKMSFGTGHHETTQLMIKALIENQPVGKKVLDLGTGTGVLAILAMKMGALKVVAMDIDQWAYDNAIENINSNGYDDVELIKGNVRALPPRNYHLIMANINRNVLLDEMEEYARLLYDDAILVLSGFLKTDYIDIENSVMNNDMIIKQVFHEKSWMALVAVKKKTKL
ncbi:MAG TPA: 50S ribosomal protein L11 methyltransferase [Bacteroidales bacterium]|nr:50S ribosomal protein L11 methyltransferase [Bacteroidales bacterium]